MPLRRERRFIARSTIRSIGWRAVEPHVETPPLAVFVSESALNHPVPAGGKARVRMKKQQYAPACSPSAGVHLPRTAARRIYEPITQGMGDAPGRVPAASVGHYHLDAPAAQRLQRQERLRDRFRLVEHRDDDRDRRQFHGCGTAPGFAFVPDQFSAPPQLLPCPAVQPKQWSRIAIGRPSRSVEPRSATWVRGEPLSCIGSPSIWLKSQS